MDSLNSVADRELSKENSKLYSMGWLSLPKQNDTDTDTEKEKEKDVVAVPSQNQFVIPDKGINIQDLDQVFQSHLMNKMGKISSHRDFVLKSKPALYHVKDDLYLIKYQAHRRNFIHPMRHYFDLLHNAEQKQIDLYPRMIELIKNIYEQPSELFDKYLPMINQNPSYDEFRYVRSECSLETNSYRRNEDPLIPIIYQYLMLYFLDAYIELRTGQKYAEMFTKFGYNGSNLTLGHILCHLIRFEKEGQNFKVLKSFLSEYFAKLSQTPDHRNTFAHHLLYLAGLYHNKLDAHLEGKEKSYLIRTGQDDWFSTRLDNDTSLRGYCQSVGYVDKVDRAHYSMGFLMDIYHTYNEAIQDQENQKDHKDQKDQKDQLFNLFKVKMDQILQLNKHHDETSKYANSDAFTGFALVQQEIVNQVPRFKLIKEFLGTIFEEVGEYKEIPPEDFVESFYKHKPKLEGKIIPELSSNDICTSYIVNTGRVVDNKVEFAVYAADKKYQESHQNCAMIKMYVNLCDLQKPDIVFNRVYEYSHRLGTWIREGDLFCHMDDKNYFMYRFLDNRLGTVIANVNGPSFKCGGWDFGKEGPEPDLFVDEQIKHHFYDYHKHGTYDHYFKRSSVACSYDENRMIFCGVSTFDPEWQYDKNPQPDNFKSFIKHVRQTYSPEQLHITYRAKFVFLCMIDKKTFKITHFSHSFIPINAKHTNVHAYGLAVNKNGSIMISYSEYDLKNNVMFLNKELIDKLLLPASEMFADVNKHHFYLVGNHV